MAAEKKRRARKPTRRAKRPDLMETIAKHVDDDSYLDTVHSGQRRGQRNITIVEMTYVLKNGHHEKSKDEFRKEHNDWNYSIRGKTVDGRDLRVAVAFEPPNLLIITAIELTRRKK